MPYEGPDTADLSNVEALNSAYLDWLGGRGRGSIPAGLRERLTRLDRRGRQCLARAPFLLMSFREYDERCWRGLIEDSRSEDLLTPLGDCDETAARLVAAGLAFLWQLARRNCYAARLVTGAGLAWCERLGECMLVDLLDRAAGRQGLLEPRLADNERLWSKLLGGGVSPRRDVRVAARVSALQVVLTSTPPAAISRLPAAACRLPAPRPRRL